MNIFLYAQKLEAGMEFWHPGFSAISELKEGRMENLITQIQEALTLLRAQMVTALFLISFFWVLLIINKLLGYRLNVLGVYPRDPAGLMGVCTHPFLHSSFNHLFFNSVPLFVLLTFMLTLGTHQLICATVFIVLLSGSLTWLLGRKAIHVGASGLIMGYWGYLLGYAYQYPSILTYILALICLYYFGSLLLSIFPSEERVSWEGHLFGLIAGIATTFLCHT